MDKKCNFCNGSGVLILKKYEGKEYYECTHCKANVPKIEPEELEKALNKILEEHKRLFERLADQ